MERIPDSVPAPERPLATLALIALVSVGLFSGTLGHDLIWDDLRLVTEHPAVERPWDVGSVLGSSYWAGGDGLYRPLTVWTVALNHQANLLLGLPGAHPVGYRCFNLLLHAAVSCLFYVFLREIGLPGWPGAAAALLFAAHPLHTEAVAAVVGRGELLAAGFGLLFVILHRRGRPFAAMACLLVALVSKESAISFLGLSLWAQLCFAVDDRRRRLRAYWPYGIAAASWLVLRTAVLLGPTEPVSPVDNPLVQASAVPRLLTAAWVQVEYLRLQLVPVGLSSDYSFNQIPIVLRLSDPRFMGFLAVASSVLGVALIARKSHPIVPFATVGYAVLFAVTGNVLFPIGTIMGERLAYAPSLMFCALAGYLLWRLRSRAGRAAIVTLVAGLVLYAALTIDRGRVWADEASFVHAQVRSAPYSAKAHYHMGRFLDSSGAPTDAQRSYRRALEILPRYTEAWYWLGNSYFQAGEPASAVRAYRRAVAVFPAHWQAWNGLGLSYNALGDLKEAGEALRRAVGARPDDPELRYNLGWVLHRQGQLDTAAEQFRAAVRLDPERVDAYTGLGTIQAQKGDLESAAKLWRRALELDPDHETARSNLDRLGSRP